MNKIMSEEKGIKLFASFLEKEMTVAAKRPSIIKYLFDTELLKQPEILSERYNHGKRYKGKT